MSFQDYAAGIETWNGYIQNDAVDVLKKDWQDVTSRQAEAMAAMAKLCQLIPYAKNYREEHGISMGAKLDMSKVSEAELATPVTSYQKVMRDLAQYLDMGANYREQMDFIHDVMNVCDEKGFPSEELGEAAFGRPVPDMLDYCKTQESAASTAAYSREMQKCAKRGYKNYMLEALDLYGEPTAMQSMVFLHDCNDAYASVKYDKDMLKDFYVDCADIYGKADSEQAKRSMDKMFSTFMDKSALSDVKVMSLTRDNELDAAFSTEYDAWEVENSAQLE